MKDHKGRVMLGLRLSDALLGSELLPLTDENDSDSQAVGRILARATRMAASDLPATVRQEVPTLAFAFWPWLEDTSENPLPCHCESSQPRLFGQVINHLYEQHVAQKGDWTERKLAEWVRSVEPPLVPRPGDPENWCGTYMMGERLLEQEKNNRAVIETTEKKENMAESLEEEPWEGVSAADIRLKIDSTLVEDPTAKPLSGRVLVPRQYASIGSVLLNVLDSEERRSQAEESLENESVDEIFRRFLLEPPGWVVFCDVTDSMVSGEWGLKSFEIGGRGYLYHQPDYGIGDDESLRIVGAWEPAEDAQAFRVCFLKTYARTWDQFCLPPAMGQWASGPPDLILDAVCAVLHEHAESWSVIHETLRKYERRRLSLETLVKGAMQRTGMPWEVVSRILRPYSNVDGVEAVFHPESLTEQESRILVAAFLEAIDGSPCSPFRPKGR